MTGQSRRRRASAGNALQARDRRRPAVNDGKPDVTSFSRELRSFHTVSTLYSASPARSAQMWAIATDVARSVVYHACLICREAVRCVSIRTQTQTRN